MICELSALSDRSRSVTQTKMADDSHPTKPIKQCCRCVDPDRHNDSINIEIVRGMSGR